MNIYRSLFLFFYLSVFFGSIASCALALGPEKVCKLHALRHERLKGIPPHLLASISKVESGRYDKLTKKIVAWPWTINVAGKGFRYKSKHEAIAAVKKMQSQGIKSIDVGCMQVNLHHHKKAFKTLEDAFDPRKNIDYAARFLSDLKETHKSWTKAVAHYHSATPKHHRPYRKKVYDTWRKERLSSKGKDTRKQHHKTQRESRWAALRARAKAKNLLAKISGTETSLKRRRTPNKTPWASNLQKRSLSRYRERAQKNLMVLKKRRRTGVNSSKASPSLTPTVSLTAPLESSLKVRKKDFNDRPVHKIAHQSSDNKRQQSTSQYLYKHPIKSEDLTLNQSQSQFPVQGQSQPIDTNARLSVRNQKIPSSITSQPITVSKTATPSATASSLKSSYADMRAYAQKLLAQSSHSANKQLPPQ